MTPQPNTLTVYQLDAAGHFTGSTVADESPLEPGVYHLPAGCVQQRPPESWPDDQWPRWNGSEWQLVPRPLAPAAMTPAEKLAAFLLSNPDVQSLLG